MKRLHLRNLVVAVSFAALAACGGGSGSSSLQPTAASTGAAMVTLTDAPGDFVSYIVNVVSIQLKRADGTVVETLPAASQVDFTQLVNLSEVISAAQVPAGSYVSASLTLDYSAASIVVDNGAGSVTVPAANIINGATSSPLTSPNNLVTLSLQLPANQPLVVTKGSVANLALDFNLAASNVLVPSTLTSTTPASSVTVTVNPVLAASIVPDATKSIRVRGPLVSVTNTSSATSYTVHVRPFYDADGSHGDLVVNTTATTTFAINGTSYTGTAGLTALAALPAATLTAALGTFDATTNVYTATSMLAGTSVTGAGTGQDSVEGTVIARTGNLLTLSNGLITHRDQGGVEFGRQTMATVASTTSVVKETLAGTFTAADISVGQHARLFGTLGTDSSGNTNLDATQGSARLQATSLWGLFGSSMAGVVTLNLQSIDGRPASVFTFAGTGTATAQDAVASSYTVAVPTGLSAGAVSQGTPIRFLGYVNPFGTAPPDFTAQTLVNYAATASRLGLAWSRPGVTAPFVAPLSATNVVISQATIQTSQVHVLQTGPQRLDLSTVTTGVTLVPDAGATSTLYAIAHRSSRAVNTYSAFADEIAALNTALNGTTALLGVDADGPYNATTGTLSVDHVVFVLND